MLALCSIVALLGLVVSLITNVVFYLRIKKLENAAAMRAGLNYRGSSV